MAGLAEELILQVRWPIVDLEAEARRKHGLKQKLVDFKLEGDALVLYFSSNGAVPARPVEPSNKAKTGPARPEPAPKRKSSKRNRMKTRGWEVVGKIKNSRGLTAIIYKPFVDALKSGDLTPAEQRTVVARILRSNGNQPEDASVEYFLNNTLEYLTQRKE